MPKLAVESQIGQFSDAEDDDEDWVAPPPRPETLQAPPVASSTMPPASSVHVSYATAVRRSVGRGRAATLPAWMTQSGSTESSSQDETPALQLTVQPQPPQQQQQIQENQQSLTAEATAPSPSPLGRGRAAVLPAWMTQHQHTTLLAPTQPNHHQDPLQIQAILPTQQEPKSQPKQSVARPPARHAAMHSHQPLPVAHPQRPPTAQQNRKRAVEAIVTTKSKKSKKKQKTRGAGDKYQLLAQSYHQLTTALDDLRRALRTPEAADPRSAIRANMRVVNDFRQVLVINHHVGNLIKAWTEAFHKNPTQFRALNAVMMQSQEDVWDYRNLVGLISRVTPDLLTPVLERLLFNPPLHWKALREYAEPYMTMARLLINRGANDAVAMKRLTLLYDLFELAHDSSGNSKRFVKQVVQYGEHLTSNSIKPDASSFVSLLDGPRLSVSSSEYVDLSTELYSAMPTAEGRVYVKRILLRNLGLSENYMERIREHLTQKKLLTMDIRKRDDAAGDGAFEEEFLAFSKLKQFQLIDPCFAALVEAWVKAYLSDNGPRFRELAPLFLQERHSVPNLFSKTTAEPTLTKGAIKHLATAHVLNAVESHLFRDSMDIPTSRIKLDKLVVVLQTRRATRRGAAKEDQNRCDLLMRLSGLSRDGDVETFLEECGEYGQLLSALSASHAETTGAEAPLSSLTTDITNAPNESPTTVTDTFHAPNSKHKKPDWKIFTAVLLKKRVRTTDTPPSEEGMDDDEIRAQSTFFLDEFAKNNSCLGQVFGAWIDAYLSGNNTLYRELCEVFDTEKDGGSIRGVNASSKMKKSIAAVEVLLFQPPRKKIQSDDLEARITEYASSLEPASIEQDSEYKATERERQLRKCLLALLLVRKRNDPGTFLTLAKCYGALKRGSLQQVDTKLEYVQWTFGNDDIQRDEFDDTAREKAATVAVPGRFGSGSGPRKENSSGVEGLSFGVSHSDGVSPFVPGVPTNRDGTVTKSTTPFFLDQKPGLSTVTGLLAPAVIGTAMQRNPFRWKPYQSGPLWSGTLTTDSNISQSPPEASTMDVLYDGNPFHPNRRLSSANVQPTVAAQKDDNDEPKESPKGSAAAEKTKAALREAKSKLRKAMLAKKRALEQKKEAARAGVSARTKKKILRPINALLKGGLDSLVVSDIDTGPAERVRVAEPEKLVFEVWDELDQYMGVDDDEHKIPASRNGAMDGLQIKLPSVDENKPTQDETMANVAFERLEQQMEKRLGKEELLKSQKAAERAVTTAYLRRHLTQQRKLRDEQREAHQKTTLLSEKSTKRVNATEREIAEATAQLDELEVRSCYLESEIAKKASRILSIRQELHELEHDGKSDA